MVRLRRREIRHRQTRQLLLQLVNDCGLEFHIGNHQLTQFFEPHQVFEAGARDLRAVEIDGTQPGKSRDVRQARVRHSALGEIELLQLGELTYVDHPRIGDACGGHVQLLKHRQLP